MRRRFAAVFGLLLCTTACSEATLASSDSDNLIGGATADDPSLDAVGSLARISNGTAVFFCSGTLVAPNVVLTAKHCAIEATGQLKMDNAEIVFALGSDAARPRRTVRAKSVMISPVTEGGFMSLGSDVAAYILEEAITDIRPMKIASAALAASDESKTFVSVGYGFEDQAQTTKGRRKAGAMTIRAASGKPFERIFGSYEAYEGYFRSLEGDEYIAQWKAELRKLYEYTLLEGYEAYGGLADENAQLCNGDSGGPLIARIGDENVLVAVGSSVVVGTKVPCSGGAAFATLGPVVQEMIAAATSDACAAVSRQGSCEGSKLTTCTDPSNTARRVVEIDCALSGGRCALGDDQKFGCQR